MPRKLRTLINNANVAATKSQKTLNKADVLIDTLIDILDKVDDEVIDKIIDCINTGSLELSASIAGKDLPIVLKFNLSD